MSHYSSHLEKALKDSQEQVSDLRRRLAEVSRVEGAPLSSKVSDQFQHKLGFPAILPQKMVRPLEALGFSPRKRDTNCFF